MGWFDGDDDDGSSSDEESKTKSKVGLMALSEASSSRSADPAPNVIVKGQEDDTDAAGAADTDADNDDDNDDPLDAYMKSLEGSNSTTKQQPQRAARLDVDNEDEATGHWKLSNDEHPLSEEEEEEYNQHQAAASKKILDATFVKAGGGASKNTNVDIQLEQVQHNTMSYKPFQKVFVQPTDTSTGHDWRRQNDTLCTPTAIDPLATFDVIPFSFGLQQNIQRAGYSSPTPVQAQTLAVALAGRDALITAATGSGKTLAYVWPLLIHLGATSNNSGMALILVPTREIASQVHKHTKRMMNPASSSSGGCIAITGGVNRYQLVQDLKRNPAQVIVATPGRLLDVLSTKKNGFDLSKVTFLVLDECDRMLDMGFEAQVTQLLNSVRPDRQSMLLSATLGRKVERVAQQWLDQPIRIAVGQTGRASDHVQQHVMVLPNFHAKKTWLKEMLPILQPLGRTLVFVATRADCETLAASLESSSDSVLTLHGDKHASDRQSALRQFKSERNGTHTILIATDVAARGLDISVATVVCFDPAKTLDIHVHRIGRAGRLDGKEGNYREGTAYTLLLKNDRKNADFAHVLLNALERDSKEVSPELRQLALSSRRHHSGNVESRGKWDKGGLGFEQASLPSNNGPHESVTGTENNTSSAGSYYGPSSSHGDMPPAKKSRWG